MKRCPAMGGLCRAASGLPAPAIAVGVARLGRSRALALPGPMA